MGAKDEKHRLRNQVLSVRNSLENREEKDERILKCLLNTSWYQQTKCIYTYVSYQSEVDTRRLIHQAWKDQKRIAVPRVAGREMEFYQICEEEDLEPGIKGILEPKKICKKMTKPGLMILPGSVFDVQGHRIGYGGGFYDRYISRISECLKIAFAYRCQVLKEIPWEPWDQTVNMIITEEGIANELN